MNVILIGAGDGLILRALEQQDPASRVVVLEPDTDAAARLLARAESKRWLAEGRLRVLAGPDYVGAADSARHLNAAGGSEVIVNRTLAAERPEDVKRATAVAKAIREGAAANAEARRTFAGPYLLQTLANLPVIAREGNVAALDNLFAGRPAVIVAAGPSLDRTVKALVPFQDRVFIVAADTTLRPLLAAGVRPHVVIGLDPAALNAKHLSGLPDTTGIYLAGEGSLHPSAFRAFEGRTFVFQVSNHEPWPWLAGQHLGRGQLRAWGSVATAALDLALRAGCNPIIFTGHDLAYTDNRPYCDNTVFHEEWRAYLAHNSGTIEHYEDLMMQGRPLVEAAGLDNTPVKTTPHLMAFRDWIVEQTTVTTDRTFINATGAGILRGPRIAQRDLAETLATLAPAELPFRTLLAEQHVTTRGSIQFSNPTDDVIERWIAFTAGTVTRADILAAFNS